MQERIEAEVGPVSVSSPGVGEEELVVGEERWDEMHRLKAAGMTVSGIARATGLDRKTVRRCLRQVRWQAYRRPAKREALLDTHRAWLVERAAEVGYSARILYQELCAQRGFEGGYGTVRDAVRPLRLETAAAALTQCRFETEPGEQAQVDWGQVRVPIGSRILEVHIFVMTLGYSRRAWVEGYEHERMDSLLLAHEHAFEHFAGVTREILYDRMRTVMLKRARRPEALEPDLPGLCPALGIRAAGVPAVSRANEGQGRVWREVRQAQLRAGAGVSGPGGL